MRRSPLHQLNERLGARFVDFGGWEMPVQYDSVLSEHGSVRTGVGVFDVTHLGRFALSGRGAHSAISRLLCNDIDRIEPGRCQYTMSLNSYGGIIDDLIVWWRGPDDYWLMPNAANHEAVMAAFSGEAGCDVTDLQASTVFLAVQGPEAPEVIENVLGVRPSRFRNAELDNDVGPVAMAGTGYTGEAGAEICVEAAAGEVLMRRFFDAGASPCGLGARDTLRLEAGLPLWGQDIDETTTPFEANLEFAVGFDHDFVGRDRLLAESQAGVSRRLTGFILHERGIPRHGYRVRSGQGEGTVTSGNISPILQSGVGLAYMSPPVGIGEGIEVSIRDKWVPGHTARPPFHEEP